MYLIFTASKIKYIPSAHIKCIAYKCVQILFNVDSTPYNHWDRQYVIFVSPGKKNLPFYLEATKS